MVAYSQVSLQLFMSTPQIAKIQIPRKLICLQYALLTKEKKKKTKKKKRKEKKRSQSIGINKHRNCRKLRNGDHKLIHRVPKQLFEYF